MQQLESQNNTVDTTAYEGEIQLVFSQVYLLMTLGLVVTALVAAWVSTSPTMLRLIYTNWWVPLALFVVQIVLVIALTAAITRLSAGAAVALFIGYAALLGVSLSAIFIVYTDASIATTFLVTGGTFGVMSIFGFGFTGVQFQNRPEATVIGSYVYGATFSLGWSACVGPILGGILTLLATQGMGILQGVFLAFIYAMGLGLPLLLSIVSAV